MAVLAGYEIGRIGLGTMALAVEGRPSRDHAIEVIHAALDAGVRYVDTAWSYYLPTQPGSGLPGDLGYGESLVAEALSSWNGPRDDVLVATKTGWRRTLDDHGRYGWRADARPETMLADVHQSMQRLGVDSIPLLYSHCDDPQLPYERQMMALRSFVDEGLVRHVGISRVGVADIDIASSILGDSLVAVQNQFSPVYRDPERTLGHVCDMGRAFVCFSPLGGFLDPVDDSLLDRFREVAARRHCSYQRVALAWELARDPHVIVIPSARTVEEVVDNVAANQLKLDFDELAFLDGMPV
ncbi:aldo/keto reductase [uncultured Bifidobacterium sp.]|uniref:aldo/keto reductase n=1 Tax=uncultured Bifidobacterium sp. TaxID=165187 RepID=UPI002609AD21|nr:aldo/keto reductase [uncultured Bifidobacterium sp.]